MPWYFFCSKETFIMKSSNGKLLVKENFCVRLGNFGKGIVLNDSNLKKIINLRTNL